METYIVKIYRRQGQGEEPLLAGIIEDALTGRKVQFASPEGLLQLLKMEEKPSGSPRKSVSGQETASRK